MPPVGMNRRSRILRRRSRRKGKTQLDLTDAPEQGLQRKTDLRVEVSVQQVHGQRVERRDVLRKTLPRKVCVAFDDVHDHGPPRGDVPLLRLFVEADVASDDVCAESAESVSLAAHAQ